MASLSVTVGDGRVFTLTVVESSTDVEKNQSTLTWTLTTNTVDSNRRDSYIFAKVDDQTVCNQEYAWNGTQGFPVAGGSISGTLKVTHNTDGSKSIPLYIEGYSYYHEVYSNSGTMTLSNIPRASSMTLASSYTIGTAGTITVTKQSASFTHTITAKIGNYTQTICTKSSATSVSFTPSTNFYSRIPDTSKATATFTIQTYSGNTAVGSPKTATASIVVPSNIKPTISSVVVAEDTASGFNLEVQSLSKPKFTATATPGTGATIISYLVTVDGTSVSSSSNVIKLGRAWKGGGTLAYTVKVTDSRGRTDTYTGSVLVYYYAAPSLTLKVRVSGTTVTVSYKVKVSSVNKTNAKSLTVQCVKVSTAEVIETRTITLPAHSETNPAGGTVIDDSYDLTFTDVATETYTFHGTLQDSKNTVNADAATGIVTLSLLRGGKGAAFFGEADTENELDVNNADIRVIQSRTSGPSPAIKIENGATSRRQGIAMFASYSNNRNTGLYWYDMDSSDTEDIITKRPNESTRIPTWASTGSATQPVYFNSNGIPVPCNGAETAAVTPVSTYASLSGSYSRLKIVGNMAFLSISFSMQAISAQAEFITIASIPSEYAPSTDWYFSAMERNTEKAHFMVINSSGQIRIYPRSAAIANGAILRGSTSWVIDN